jgi:hypothetical protein
MLRNFRTRLIGFDGEPIADGRPVDASGRPADPARHVRLYDVTRDALLAQFPDEQLTGQEKYDRYSLLGRITSDVNKNKLTTVSAEEVALIKKLIGKGYGPAVVGPAYDAMECEPEPSRADDCVPEVAADAGHP